MIIKKDRTIEYFVKQVYGISKFYIKDPQESKMIQTLTGTKTLSINQQYVLEWLGIEMKQVFA